VKMTLPPDTDWGDLSNEETGVSTGPRAIAMQNLKSFRLWPRLAAWLLERFLPTIKRNPD
jgi:hypothetical protein